MCCVSMSTLPSARRSSTRVTPKKLYPSLASLSSISRRLSLPICNGACRRLAAWLSLTSTSTDWKRTGMVLEVDSTSLSATPGLIKATARTIRSSLRSEGTSIANGAGSSLGKENGVPSGNTPSPCISASLPWCNAASSMPSEKNPQGNETDNRNRASVDRVT